MVAPCGNSDPPPPPGKIPAYASVSFLKDNEFFINVFFVRSKCQDFQIVIRGCVILQTLFSKIDQISICFLAICSSYSFYPHRVFLFILLQFYARSSQSCFPIHSISSMVVHPNRVLIFILFPL